MMEKRELLHRLLYLALVEMRLEAHEIKNSLVFYLADLLHTLPLDLERGARSEISYDEIVTELNERAREKGCDEWLAKTLQEASRVRVYTPDSTE